MPQRLPLFLCSLAILSLPLSGVAEVAPSPGLTTTKTAKSDAAIRADVVAMTREFMAVVVAGKGEQAMQYIHPNTFRALDESLHLARTADKQTLLKQPFAVAMPAVAWRCYLSADELRTTLTAKVALQHLVDRGIWEGDKLVIDPVDIHLSNNRQRAGLSLFKDEKPEYVFRRNQGRWQFDISEFIESVKTVLGNDSVSEQELFNFAHKRAGRSSKATCPEDIWTPVAPVPPPKLPAATDAEIKAAIMAVSKQLEAARLAKDSNGILQRFHPDTHAFYDQVLELSKRGKQGDIIQQPVVVAMLALHLRCILPAPELMALSDSRALYRVAMERNIMRERSFTIEPEHLRISAERTSVDLMDADPRSRGRVDHHKLYRLHEGQWLRDESVNALYNKDDFKKGLTAATIEQLMRGMVASEVECPADVWAIPAEMQPALPVQ